MDKTQEVKQFLERAKRLDRLIRCDLDEIKRLRILADSLGGIENSERVQASIRLESRFADMINEISDREAEIQERIKEKERMLREVTATIYMLSDNLEIEILLYRYVQYMSFREIAKKAYVSVGKAYKIHDNAIGKLSKMNVLNRNEH